MATYTSNACASTVQPRADIGIQSVTGTHTVSVALVANDIVQLVQVPVGACIQEIVVSCSGSLGSTLTAEFGDGSDTDRFIASGTFGQGAGSLAKLTAITGNGYVYTANDTIDMKVNSAAAGTTGVVITTTVIYSLQSVLA